MDYSQLLGFPPELAGLALILFTVTKIVELVVNRRKSKTEDREDENTPQP